MIGFGEGGPFVRHRGRPIGAALPVAGFDSQVRAQFLQFWYGPPAAPFSIASP